LRNGQTGKSTTQEHQSHRGNGENPEVSALFFMRMALSLNWVSRDCRQAGAKDSADANDGGP
jgi:hypothetical protein